MSEIASEPASIPSAEARKGGVVSTIWEQLPRPLQGASIAVAAVAIVAPATLAGSALAHWLPHSSAGLAYLLCVVLAAVAFGVATGLATAFLAFLAYNFFFIPPIYTFTIADPQELIALLVFFAVALLTGSIAGRLREVADQARHRATTLQSLDDFAASLASTTDMPSILAALAQHSATTARGKAIVLLEGDNGLEIKATHPGGITLSTADLQAAQRAFRSGVASMAAAPGWLGPEVEFRPLKTSSGTIGLVGLKTDDGRRMVAQDDSAALGTVLRHGGIAIERTVLAEQTAVARDEIERERLRSILLSSLSHDLRTPLASILGSVTSLRQIGTSLPEAARDDLLAAIEEETRRLAQFVSNLLDMTRLETEAPDLRRDWIDIVDAARSAIQRARQYFPQSDIRIIAPTAIPLAKGDGPLFENVVFNLLDNAVKFSEPRRPIVVNVASGAGVVELTVTDQGPGIRREELKHIFDKFYRAETDRRVSGTGLGLTICKRVVEGMGGTIRAESPVTADGGTRVTLHVPAATGEATE